MDAEPAAPTVAAPAARPLTLHAVDEATLADLIAAAVEGADPDDVTPPIEDAGWSEARLDWIRDVHRSRRDGLDGLHGEATWALRRGVAEDGVEGPVVGAVHLRRKGDAGVLEIGMWLTRDARGEGLGGAAVEAVIDRAVAYGATAVYAQTTIGNVRAIGVLRKLGFALTRGTTDNDVRALLRLTDR